MHEWGITESIVEEVIREARKHGLDKVDKVRLSLGNVIDLTPDSLEFCFQCLSKGTIAEEAALEITEGERRGITIDSLEGEQGTKANGKGTSSP